MAEAYLNRIAAAVPAHDVHRKFIEYAPSLLADERDRQAFRRMAARSGIGHRYSSLCPDPDPEHLDREGFFRRGAFPGTGERMRRYEKDALPLAARAVEALDLEGRAAGITHIVTTCCTGFSAPGVDLDLAARFGFGPSVERTVIGFMGCHAAINALKAARHIIRSEPASRVLVLNLELCTLHLKETTDLDQVLSFLIFADGCAAALVSAEPVGLQLRSFRAALLPGSDDLITWKVGDQGFDMMLSGRVPQALLRGLPAYREEILRGRRAEDISLWAVHPGGRAVLDAVERGFGLSQGDLAVSREVLREYGNMSSATIMFVLKAIMEDPAANGIGCAIAFGPGLVAETMLFGVVR